ncbi:MAG: 2-dehydropantoate 2-reductase N-terminal domain-containing protein [Myxococcota bacterium]
MSVTIWGPGAVGLVLGARLADAGEDVLFVCRSDGSADRIAREGVHFEDVGSDQRFHVHASAIVADEVAAEHIGTGPVLLCVRTQQTEPAASRLGQVAARSPVAVVQNGLPGQALVAAAHPVVIGAVYRQTCTRRSANSVVSLGAGRIVIGGHDQPGRRAASALSELLERAGYDVGVSDQIEQDKWLKLCINLMSAPNALIRRQDHETTGFVAIKSTLLEEARAATQAAGVVASSCDGRDRSLDEEIAFQRGALEHGVSVRSLPLYNQVWSALKRGEPVEADEYHREILDLSRTHAVAAPMNARILLALERAARGGLGPESFSADEILSLDPHST